MDCLQEMESLGMLTQEQHLEIRAWVTSPLSSQQIALGMPEHLQWLLWQAGTLMEYDPEAIPFLLPN